MANQIRVYSEFADREIHLEIDPTNKKRLKVSYNNCRTWKIQCVQEDVEFKDLIDGFVYYYKSGTSVNKSNYQLGAYCKEKDSEEDVLYVSDDDGSFWKRKGVPTNQYALRSEYMEEQKRIAEEQRREQERIELEKEKLRIEAEMKREQARLEMDLKKAKEKKEADEKRQAEERKRKKTKKIVRCVLIYIVLFFLFKSDSSSYSDNFIITSIVYFSFRLIQKIISWFWKTLKFLVSKK